MKFFRGKRPGREAEYSLYLVPRLRMIGAIPSPLGKPERSAETALLNFCLTTILIAHIKQHRMVDDL